MKKKLLLCLQSCPDLLKVNFARNTFLLIGMFVTSLSGFAQGPGHPNVDAGEDVVLECNETCTDLTATYLYTGDTNTYSVSSIPYDPPFPFLGGTPVAVNIDDRWSNAITLPFDFCFYGQAYTQMVIGSNAVVSFDLAQNPPNSFCEWDFDESIPNPNLFHAAIFGPYMDIHPATGDEGKINWTVFGTSPDRTMVVNFNDIKYFYCNNLKLTSQIVMYETTNVIEIYIKDRFSGCSWNDGNAVIGIQNQDGTIGETAPGRNTGDWSATHEAWRYTPNGNSNVVFSWLDADGNVIGTEPTINVCPTDDVTVYTAQAVYTNCNGDVVTVTDDVQVTLNTDFDVTLDLGPDVVLCSETSHEIVPIITGDITGATYLWSPGGETTPTLTVTDSGTYTLEISKDGCTVTDSVNIIFEDAIDLTTNLPTDIQICSSDPFPVLDATPTNAGIDLSLVTYEWTDITGAIVSTNATYTPTAGGIYTVTIEYPCSVGIFTIDVGVTDQPFLDLGPDKVICDGNPFEIIPTITGDTTGITYLWSTGETTPTILVTAGGTYTLDITVGPCTASDSIDVSISGPLILDLGLDVELCDVNSFEIVPTITGDTTGITYLWSTGETTPTIIVSTSGTYSLEISVGTCVVTDSIDILMATSPILDLGPDETLCNGASFEIVPTITGDTTGITYLWSTGETSPTITVSASGTYTLEITVGPCTVTDSIAIIVSDPIIVDLGDDFDSCFDLNTILTAAATGDPQNATYEWFLNGILLSGETSRTLSIFQEGEYSVIVTTAEGCIGQDSVIVGVRDDIEVSVDADFQTCPNETHTLTATASEEGVTYQWLLNGNPIVGQTNSTLDISLEAGLMGAQTYSVVVSLGGCTAEDSVDITLYPIGNCVISQGISPNGDGFNDTLDLTFLNDRTGIKKLQIFNRYGTQVFEQTNYTNQWKGQESNGNDLPTGTYFYVIDLAGNDSVYGQQATGWIYLNQKG